MKKFGILAGLSTALLIGALYLVFLYVPTEATMGIVQRIFYLMVPVGWLSMLSFVVVFIASILYLRTRQERWDILAYSSAELGIVFTSLTLLTGMLWAKPVWGVWWTWEPRLTATLVLWFIYLAYFLVRSLATEESRGATFSAVVGVLGFIDIPIIGLTITLWRGIHPRAVIFQGSLAPSMLLALIISVFAYTALYFLLLTQRVSIGNGETEIKRLKASVEDVIQD